MTHSLIVLGSGQDGGTPQVGSQNTRAAERTASSIAIVSDEHDPVLFDATPDIRRQYRRLCDHTRATPDFDGVFITHGHMGHYVGLVHFGKEAGAAHHLPLFALESVLSFLDANEPWATLLRDDHLEPVPMDEAAASIGRLTVRAIPVPHRAEFTDTAAYSVSVDDRPWVLYLPDIDGWDQWPDAEAVIAEHPVSLLDATFSDVEELPGRDISEIKHPLVPDTIERFAHLSAERSIILTHINHSNPLGEPDAEVTRLAHDKGFVVAYDGMVLDHD
jgi:pyrroloquinoline quinone biosynthesis protein B